MCSHDTATQARKKEHARRQTTRTACQNMHARRLQAKTDERHWSGRQDARSFIHTCATQHQQPSTTSCSIDRAYLPSPLPSFCCLLLVFSSLGLALALQGRHTVLFDPCSNIGRYGRSVRDALTPLGTTSSAAVARRSACTTARSSACSITSSSC